MSKRRALALFDEQRCGQDLDAQRGGVLDGLIEQVRAQPAALVLRVQVNGDISGDEVAGSIVHEGEESQVSYDAEFFGVGIQRDPEWTMVRSMLSEGGVALLHGSGIEITTARASRHRIVVDLHDPGKVSLDCIPVKEAHVALARWAWDASTTSVVAHGPNRVGTMQDSYPSAGFGMTNRLSWANATG